ncbi:MAG: serine/threonine protein kinase [Myxococcales bacterium]|nr:serine/threonine protein kinase [Myxococcales bacterium]
MVEPAHQRYRVLERLAAGGMAEVYLAESAGLAGFKKRVAIKRVLPQLSGKKKFIAMFLDEARLSAHLNHSNVVHVFDIGVGDNTYFIVMEYVEGADLKAITKDLADRNRPLSIEAAIYIVSKICEGLAYAHELVSPDGELLNMVHRDVSPPNVLVSKQGEIKIVDFGLAKAATQLEKSEAGIIKGKFGYLSPEAAHGIEVDARSDIFAVGIMLWELLAGRRLFHGKTDYDTVKLVQAAVVPPIGTLNRGASDPELQRILSRALAVDRGDRYPAVHELCRDLTRFLFRYGRPVDAFDIADLARSAMRARGRKTGEDAFAIIDQLIAESLLEFTSLWDSRSGETSIEAESRERISFDAFGKMSDFQGTADQQHAEELVRNTLHDVYEAGNLAALEGPTASSRSAARDGLGVSEADLAGTAFTRRAPPSQAAPSFPPESSRGATATVYLLLVLIAAATAVAVWYARIFV